MQQGCVSVLSVTVTRVLKQLNRLIYPRQLQSLHSINTVSERRSSCAIQDSSCLWLSGVSLCWLLLYTHTTHTTHTPLTRCSSLVSNPNTLPLYFMYTGIDALVCLSVWNISIQSCWMKHYLPPSSLSVIWWDQRRCWCTTDLSVCVCLATYCTPLCDQFQT